MSEMLHYTVGGAVQSDGGIYVPRDADRKLLAACRNLKYAHVLTTRQVGKTSLIFNTMQMLAGENIRSAYVALSEIGTATSPEIWYKSLLGMIAMRLNLYADIDVWWDQYTTTPVNRAASILCDVMLTEIEDPLVVFIDEIDYTMNMEFNADEFYMLVKTMYDLRHHDSRLERLSFVLVGLSIPSTLASNKHHSLNVGERIELLDFSYDEAAVLAPGLSDDPREAEALLRSVLDWTGGHPYLTCLVCSEIQQERREEDPGAIWGPAQVDDIITRLFLGSHGEDAHNIPYVTAMLLKQSPEQLRVMRTYKAILQGTQVVNHERLRYAVNYLIVTGIVRGDENSLRVRNRIYERVFNLGWLKEHWPAKPIQLSKPVAGSFVAGLLMLVAAVILLAFKANGLADEVNKSEQKLLTQRIDRIHLRNTVTTLSRSRDTLVGETAELRSSISDLEAQQRSLKQAVGALERDTADLNAEKNRLKKTNDSTIDMLNAFVQAVPALESRNDDVAQIHLTKFIAKLDKLSDSIGEARVWALDKLGAIRTRKGDDSAAGSYYDQALKANWDLVKAKPAAARCAEFLDTLATYLRTDSVPAFDERMHGLEGCEEIRPLLIRHAVMHDSLATIREAQLRKHLLHEDPRAHDSLLWEVLRFRRRELLLYEIARKGDGIVGAHRSIALVYHHELPDLNSMLPETLRAYADSAEHHYRLAIDVNARFGRDKAERVVLVDDLVTFYERVAKLDSAVAFCDTALSLREGLFRWSDLRIAENTLHLSQLLYNDVEIRKAVSYRRYGAAHALLSRLGSELQRPGASLRSSHLSALDSLGRIYDSLGRYQQAIRVYSEAWSLRRRDPTSDTLDIAYNALALASAYGKLPTDTNGSRAIEFYQQAIELSKGYLRLADTGSRTNIARRLRAADCIRPLADYYKKRNDLEAARSYYQQWLAALNDIWGGDTSRFAWQCNVVASFYLKTGEISDACSLYRSVRASYGGTAALFKRKEPFIDVLKDNPSIGARVNSGQFPDAYVESLVRSAALYPMQCNGADAQPDLLCQEAVEVMQWVMVSLPDLSESPNLATKVEIGEARSSLILNTIYPEVMRQCIEIVERYAGTIKFSDPKKAAVLFKQAAKWRQSPGVY